MSDIVEQLRSINKITILLGVSTLTSAHVGWCRYHRGERKFRRILAMHIDTFLTLAFVANVVIPYVLVAVSERDA